MIAKVGLAVLVASGAMAASAPALAAGSQCAAHSDMIALLAKRYKEVPTAVGLVNENRVVQVFVSQAGTWTIIATKPDGDTCIIAAGKDWEEVPASMQSLDPAA